MPVGLYCGGRGIHNHRRRRVPIWLYVRRHSNQLYRVQPRWDMYYVRAGEYNIQRQHRLICIRTTLRNGIDHPGTTCHPSAEGNFSPRRHSHVEYQRHGHTRMPTAPGPRANIVCVGGSGGGWRSPDRRGVVRECKNTPLLPLVIASKAWRSSK